MPLIKACLIFLHFQGVPIGYIQQDNLHHPECSSRAALYRSRGYAPWTEYGSTPLYRKLPK